MAAPPASIGARVAARAHTVTPVALAGGDGASTLLSHLAAEHSHGRGLLGFFDNAGARRSLSRVCREFRREVDSFRWPVVELRGHTDAVYDVCALADGRVVSVSHDMTLRVWNTTSGACEQTLSIAKHKQPVLRLCALADGRVVTASWDSTLRVWNLSTCECERVLRGHNDYVHDVATLADGRVVSSSSDATLRVWNVSTGACDIALAGHSRVVFAFVNS
jgi:WD40 repeat protein